MWLRPTGDGTSNNPVCLVLSVSGLGYIVGSQVCNATQDWHWALRVRFDCKITRVGRAAVSSWIHHLLSKHTSNP